MRTAVNVGTVLALVAVSFWAPHAAFAPVSVRGPGFEARTITPAVYEDRYSENSLREQMKFENTQPVSEPTKSRVQVKAEEVRIEPTKADQYVCYLGHMLHRERQPYTSDGVSIQGIGGVYVKVDTNRLLVEYALIIAVCALLHQFLSLIPPDPETPPRPSPWPAAPPPVAVPPAARATDPPQPPAGG